MLKEREVLMVPPSQGNCYIERNVLLRGRVDSVKEAAAFNNQQQQGRPTFEVFDVGVPGGVTKAGGKCLGTDNGRQESEGRNSSDHRFLSPYSPPLPAVVTAAASSSPTMRQGVHSVMMNSKGDFGSTRAPAQNGWPTKENGFVAEKRMRNGEGLTSSPPVAGAGHPSGESFQEDGPELPLRKRVHVSDDNTVDDVVQTGGDEGLSVARGRESSSEGKSVSPGVETPTKLDEGKMSADSEEKGGLTSTRTESNGEEGVVEADEAMVVNGEDVEMVPAEEVLLQEDDIFVGPRSDHASVHVDEEGPVAGTEVRLDERTPEEFVDMDVDPISSENTVVVGSEDAGGSASPRGVEQEGVQLQQQPVWERNVEDLPQNHSGSSDLPPPPPRDPREGFFEEEERSHEGNSQTDPPQEVLRDVEVIVFDDSDDEEVFSFAEARVVYESDGSSTKGKKPVSSQVGVQEGQRNGYRYSSSESTAPSYNADAESDSDDCQLLGSWPPVNANGHVHRDGAANPVVVEDDDDNNYTTTEEQDSDSSDVEEVGDSQSDIRRRWEEAAMRRRMGRAMQSAGSKANASQGGTINLDDDRTESQGLEESVATSTYRDSPDSKDQTETSKARGGLDGVVHRTEVQQGTTSRADDEPRPARGSHVDDVVLNGVDETVEVKLPDTPVDSGTEKGVSSPGYDEGDITGSKSVRVETPGVTEFDRLKTWSTAVHSENDKGEASSRSADRNGDERSQSRHVVLGGVGNETSENQHVDAVADEADTSIAHDDLLAAKERLKQTDHYRKSDAEEWASRQQEIQRQAAESKRLRQRKRQEADRKREMERKQKERIDELRLSQRKEERQMDLRDQLRGQVRTELERIAGTCMDFATLLRQLGIQVEGGSHPTTQQVNAAYKKALFKFHPDRAVASSQGEPRKQVEAEEKFKLIQRLKDTLIPVAIDYTYPAYRTFF